MGLQHGLKAGPPGQHLPAALLRRAEVVDPAGQGNVPHDAAGTLIVMVQRLGDAHHPGRPLEQPEKTVALPI